MKASTTRDLHSRAAAAFDQPADDGAHWTALAVEA